MSVAEPLPSTAAVPSARQPLWLNVLSHLDPRFGGISAAVPALCRETAAAGRHRVGIAGFCAEDERAGQIGVPVSRFPLGRANWLLDSGLRDRLTSAVRASDGLHVHGLWQEHCALSAGYAARIRLPYVVSAHGMLEPWALRHKGFKKAVYSTLLERRNLRRARVLHALTRAEAEDYRRYGVNGPIAVVPNGVDIPPTEDASRFLRRFPSLVGQQIVLFLGRLHYKKGLDLLCRAWARVYTKHRDTTLVLAGPDSDGTRVRTERLVEELGVSHRTLFTGMLDRDLKWSALAASHLFVLPSRSEGLSVATLEALGMGVPVVISEACHLPQVGLRGCGRVVPFDDEVLADAIDEMLRSPQNWRDEMARQGRKLVEDSYRWPVVGRQMADVYDWALGGGTPPGTVEVV